jgi:8-oxo-dGTP diphosphatase
MSDRRGRKSPYTIDLVLVTALKDQLAVLLWRTPEGKEKWALPWDMPSPDEALESAAGQIATDALGVLPGWLEQLAAFAADKRHPSDSDVSVTFAGLVPAGTLPPVGGAYAWFAVSELPLLAPRQRAMLDGALVMLRARMDQSPVAFRLLPPTFTLSELQHMYELLLGKRLHKASFRRALQAAWLVEPTDEWRSEGRGRPAQLFRYSPRKRRPAQRGIRLDLLTS